MPFMRFLCIVFVVTLVFTAFCTSVAQKLGFQCDGGATRGLFVIILMIVAGIVSWLDGRKECKVLLEERRAILRDMEK